MFVGDQMMATVMRVDLEKINGHYQGACFPFVEALDSGVNRMAFAEDGSMFVGQTDRGWGSIGKKSYGLQRIVWSGRTPFEILHMEVRHDGFELTFTADIDRESALDPDSYDLKSYTYAYHSKYGAPESDVEEAQILRVVQTGPRSIRLRVDEMRTGYVYELEANGVLDGQGEPLLHAQAYYTLMELPAADDSQAVETVENKERLLFLTHSAGFEHGVVKRKSPSTLAVAEQGLIDAAGDRYEVTVTKDCSSINATNLAKYDAVLFYTTGELPISEKNLEGLIDWVARGGAFVGIHCATDTLYEYAPYMDMIGGAFDGHPWHMDVSMVVEDEASSLHGASGRYLGAQGRDLSVQMVQALPPARPAAPLGHQGRSLEGKARGPRLRHRLVQVLGRGPCVLHRPGPPPGGLDRRDLPDASPWRHRVGDPRSRHSGPGSRGSSGS